MTIHINLLNWRETQQQEEKVKGYVVIGGGFFLLFLFLFGWYLFIFLKAYAQEQRNAFLKEEIKAIEAKVLAQQNWIQNKKRLLEEVERIHHLQLNNVEVIRILDALPRWVPQGLCLISFSQAGDQLLLQGKAKNHDLIATFVSNIHKDGWLKSLQLSVLQSDSLQNQVITFQLRAFIPVWHNAE